LERSLPILAQILRSAADLEKAGLIHAGLSTKCILYADDEVMVTGLSEVCMLSDAEPGLSCNRSSGSTEWGIGDPLWQPPEVTDGTPKGPKDHVWAVGMIFLALCEGCNPLEEIMDMARHTSDKDAEGWRRRRATAFRRLRVRTEMFARWSSPDVRRLVRGLLAEDPEDRWSTEDALAEVTAIAIACGIPMPGAGAPAAAAAIEDMLSPGTIGDEFTDWTGSGAVWE